MLTTWNIKIFAFTPLDYCPTRKPAIDVVIIAVNYHFAMILAISCVVYGVIVEIYRHRKLIAHRLVQPENKLPAPRDLVDMRQSLCFFKARQADAGAVNYFCWSNVHLWGIGFWIWQQIRFSLREEMLFRTRFRELNFISLFASINIIFLSPLSRPCVFCLSIIYQYNYMI